jgi:hypothetical protein
MELDFGPAWTPFEKLPRRFMAKMARFAHATKSLAYAWLICIATLCYAGPADAQVNVTQEHNHLSRDGLYVDSAFTLLAAANLVRDTNFNGTITGNVLAQPLYIEGGPSGPMVIAVTESNNVYALNAITGNVIWRRNLGTAVLSSQLPCGNISPLGISDTPTVDLASRSLFLDAMTTPDGGTTKQHLIFSLNVDTGATNAGWPVNVNSAVPGFTSSVQNNRGALAVVNGIVYVPYSGHAGDCGSYHGWVVGVQTSNPSAALGWATSAIGGGIWGHSGVASDGTNMFVITGNTFSTGGTWGGGEAIIRLQAGPIFNNNTSNYWAPTNWLSLDNSDTDVGGCSAVLIDVPGATPSQLVLALGKDGNAYLLNRNNLGGITAPIASVDTGAAIRGQAAATYRTNQGTYFAFRQGSDTVKAYRITATNPPTIVSAWSVSQSGQGSPWVTTTDGTNNPIVWVVGTESDHRIHGYDGITGAVVFAGGGANEQMSGTRKWNTGIVARSRIYFVADNRVYAFAVPTATPSPTPIASDFNHDGKPDYVLFEATSRRTAIWYMNNNVHMDSAYGPTLPVGWQLIGVADFNGDGHPDYVLFNANTSRTAIWYLNNNVFVSSAYGPTLPGGWELVALGDFNRDGKPDYVLYNASTSRTAIWYLNNNAFLSGAYGPTLPANWHIAGVADFNHDGAPDYLLFNSNTRQTVIWYLNNNGLVSIANGPTVATDYVLKGTADFNTDSNPDYVLYNGTTQQTAIWYLNNNVRIGSAYGPTLPAGWSLVAP